MREEMDVIRQRFFATPRREIRVHIPWGLLLGSGTVVLLLLLLLPCCCCCYSHGTLGALGVRSLTSTHRAVGNVTSKRAGGPGS